MRMDSTTDKNATSCCCGGEMKKENYNAEIEPSTSKLKRNKINLPFIGLNLRRGKKNKKSQIILQENDENQSSSSSKYCIKKLSSSKWPLKFKNSKKNTKIVSTDTSDEQNCCKCTCYKKKDDLNSDEQNATSSSIENSFSSNSSSETTSSSVSSTFSSNFDNSTSQFQIRDEEIQVEIRENRLDDDDFDDSIYGVVPVQPHRVINAPFIDLCLRTIHEDCDEAARLARAREIEQGVEAPANFRPVRRVQLLCNESEKENGQRPRRLQLVCPRDLSVDSLRALFHTNVTLTSCPVNAVNGCHTQVDFIHCLVPDLLNITNCSFYWGKMDRYEAEKLLDGKPEGTFLLRDSAQEEFLFSVSFRKYGRSLHARIEQWNHKFSFDSHDPGVFTSDTVCGLIEHYKDASSCMFFEPMLTFPLHRNYPFSLQHLSRAVITSRMTYDNINHLSLPKTLKTYLKEYHYRQKVRVKKFDDDVQWLELQNM